MLLTWHIWRLCCLITQSKASWSPPDLKKLLLHINTSGQIHLQCKCKTTSEHASPKYKWHLRSKFLLQQSMDKCKNLSSKFHSAKQRMDRYGPGTERTGPSCLKLNINKDFNSPEKVFLRDFSSLPTRREFTQRLIYTSIIFFNFFYFTMQKLKFIYLIKSILATV